MTASQPSGFDDRPARDPYVAAPANASHAASSVLSGDELLTTAEVALLLRTPNATLRTWRYQGIGPRSFHLGPRGIRYKKSDVVTWLERQYGTTG